ncbi:hypothetical protein [Kriegella aquimaris]|uniref:Sensor of ECF-type sigma factor n=1 Tax=Kriegella aquimaris TaxID=192904 RepID=A0A1G9NPL0_9FLAO|nr:hypothetical protein [Kriegella aquimaris]SDL88291.1 hypothetical protein SAMN04488514_103266 [Kriegella aquimaris]
MNRLKKISTLAILLTASVFYGQREKQDWDKIKALKVAFITEQLSLTSEEAQSFWPLYNEYESNRYALRRKEHDQIRDKIKDASNLSEKAASDLLDQYLSFEEEEEELDKIFLKKAAKIISAKKSLMLIRSEEDFKKQLIRRFHQKKGDGRGR